MPQYTISALAYLKIVLHAAKYPSARVVGLLIGPASDDALVTDAIPMLHHWTDLSMATEACLQLADIHCKNHNLCFKGVYVCNELLEDIAPPATIVRLATAVAQQSPKQTTLLTALDSKRLNSGTSALIAHSVSALTTSSMKPLDASSIGLEPESAASTAFERARTGQAKLLGDFDDHLEDATVDWLDNKAIKM
ncbi:hypothetical protein OIV83_000875 [Microbotryomycetes sp. JL201]|nr:hypothetical protein OIV83_000875 [Microbotryomycetes sp. JL201]